MVNRPKQIGTACETAVARTARTRGFPGADRLTLTGANDRGDVGLCPGVIVEVKGGKAAERASDQQITAWLAETERERVNAGAALGVLVTKRPGVGPARAHDWAAWFTVTDFLNLVGATDLTGVTPGHVRLTLDSALAVLRAAGFGTPNQPNPLAAIEGDHR